MELRFEEFECERCENTGWVRSYTAIVTADGKRTGKVRGTHEPRSAVWESNELDEFAEEAFRSERAQYSRDGLVFGVDLLDVMDQLLTKQLVWMDYREEFKGTLMVRFRGKDYGEFDWTEYAAPTTQDVDRLLAHFRETGLKVAERFDQPAVKLDPTKAGAVRRNPFLTKK